MNELYRRAADFVPRIPSRTTRSVRSLARAMITVLRFGSAMVAAPVLDAPHQTSTTNIGRVRASTSVPAKAKRSPPVATSVRVISRTRNDVAPEEGGGPPERSASRATAAVMLTHRTCAAQPDSRPRSRAPEDPRPPQPAGPMQRPLTNAAEEPQGGRARRARRVSL